MQRNMLIRFVLMRFATALGSQFFIFTIPLIVFKSTGSISKSGLAFALEWGIGMIALPLGGMLADKYGGRRVYMVADLVRALTCLVGILLLKQFPNELFIIVSIAAGVTSFFANQAYVSLESLLPKYLNHDQEVKGQAVLLGLDHIGQMFGPLVAAVMTTFIGSANLIIIPVLAFLCSFVNLKFSSSKDVVLKKNRLFLV